MIGGGGDYVMDLWKAFEFVRGFVDLATIKHNVEIVCVDCKVFVFVGGQGGKEGDGCSTVCAEHFRVMIFLKQCCSGFDITRLLCPCLCVGWACVGQ